MMNLNKNPGKLFSLRIEALEGELAALVSEVKGQTSTDLACAWERIQKLRLRIKRLEQLRSEEISRQFNEVFGKIVKNHLAATDIKYRAQLDFNHNGRSCSKSLEENIAEKASTLKELLDLREKAQPDFS